MSRERILVVDDEPGVRSMLEVILRDEGYTVASVGTGEDGVEAATTGSFDAILLDVWLPGIDGLETLARLRSRGVDAEVVMISGHGTIDTAVKATKAGAFDFVEKPLSLEKTLLVVRNALRQRKLEQRNRSLMRQLTRDTEILGVSEAVQLVRRAAEAAGASDAPVLLYGEPGSGRETVARRVHAASRRGERPFVHVPCGAFDAAVAAPLLFGADGDAGRLALARSGSVYLEDVDALPEVVQSRLAAWLSAEHDVRVLAGAGPEAVGVSPALRDQLDVIRIDIPPLRVRREDIAPIATRFLQDLAVEYGRPAPRIAPEAMAALTRHDWPGNLKALRNLVEKLVLLSPHDEIRAADLPAELGGAAAPVDDLYGPFASLADGRRAFDRQFLRRVLREEKGDPVNAARRAGVTVTELEDRLG